MDGTGGVVQKGIVDWQEGREVDMEWFMSTVWRLVDEFDEFIRSEWQCTLEKFESENDTEMLVKMLDCDIELLFNGWMTDNDGNWARRLATRRLLAGFLDNDYMVEMKRLMLNALFIAWTRGGECHDLERALQTRINILTKD